MSTVLGVDGCPGGWCCVAIEANGGHCQVGDPRVYPSFAEVMAATAGVICVDIPIGLLDRPGQRECDVQARRLLGIKRGSVFPPPSRAALKASDFPEACDINEALTGKRLTMQSFKIGPKIRQVDDRLSPQSQGRVLEVHPELCFWALNACSPAMSKKVRVAGRIERWEILGRSLPALAPSPPPRSELPEGCKPDDFIDALVCAWTAACVLQGKAERIPVPPELDGRGLRMEMWYPAL